jgi:hypothetical protein
MKRPLRFAPPSTLWLVLPAALLLTGCGSEAVSLKGTVKLDGQPLKDVSAGTVSFVPTKQGDPVAYGDIQKDGSYVVRTGKEKGIKPGEYRVAVSATGPMPEATRENPEPLPESLIPAMYNDAKTSGLNYTVSSGGTWDIELKSQ